MAEEIYKVKENIDLSEINENSILKTWFYSDIAEYIPIDSYVIKKLVSLYVYELNAFIIKSLNKSNECFSPEKCS